MCTRPLINLLPYGDSPFIKVVRKPYLELLKTMHVERAKVSTLSLILTAQVSKDSNQQPRSAYRITHRTSVVHTRLKSERGVRLLQESTALSPLRRPLTRVVGSGPRSSGYDPRKPLASRKLESDLGTLWWIRTR